MVLPASLWTEGGIESAIVEEVEDMVETCVGIRCLRGWGVEGVQMRGRKSRFGGSELVTLSSEDRKCTNRGPRWMFFTFKSHEKGQVGQIL